jgi:hypothetical protein
MPKWIDEIKYDLKFLRSHTLQPQWFKIAKCSAVENLDRIMRSIRDGLNSRVPVQIRLA